MNGVLLLNQSYEPISIISWRRGVKLLVLEKAEIVKEYDEVLRSSLASVKMPSVMRLVRAFRRPRKRVRFNRTNILARDRWRCCYCGKISQPDELTFDHVLPKSRGGKTCWDNIVSCCIPCNSRKGNREPHEANLILKRRPVRPDFMPIFSFILSRQKELPEDWEDFCYKE